MKTYIKCRRDWNISKGRGLTLIGIVDSYTKKTEAEKQLKVMGVKVVVEKLRLNMVPAMIKKMIITYSMKF